MKQLLRYLLRSLSGIIILGVVFEKAAGVGASQRRSVRSIQSNELALSSSRPSLESEGLVSTKVILRKKEKLKKPKVQSRAGDRHKGEEGDPTPSVVQPTSGAEVDQVALSLQPAPVSPARARRTKPQKKVRKKARSQERRTEPVVVKIREIDPKPVPTVQDEILPSLPFIDSRENETPIQNPIAKPASVLNPVFVSSPAQPLVAPSVPTGGAGRPTFSGFYVGFAGGLGHLYTEGSLYSKSYKPVKEKESDNKLILYDQMKTVFYGSYSENENTWLAEGSVFAGFDQAVFKHLRVGIEIQGAYGGRSVRVASNGVYACRSKNQIAQEKYTDKINLDGRTGIDDVIFGYTRPKLRTPYSFTVTPRIGVPLFSGTLLYTKFGIKYENYEIKDTAEENIEASSYQKNGKATDDVIYDKTRPSFVGGIGLEALVTKGIFLRLEGACSGGPDIHLEKSELIKTDDSDRALEDLEIKKMRNFYLGLGAGMRF